MLKTLIFPRPVKPKRRSFTAEQKRLIAEESLAPGVSVSRIARAHDVNIHKQPAEQDGLIELHLASGGVCVSGS